MSLPSSFAPLLDNILENISVDPLAGFAPQKRKLVWQTLVDQDFTTAEKASSLLALKTAYHVLPIFERSAEYMVKVGLGNHISLANDALLTAQAILDGKGDVEAAFRQAGNEHNLIGNIGGKLPCNTDMALLASNKALVQVARPSFQQLYFNSFLPSTDLEWATSGQADATSTAVIAWSCSKTSYEPDRSPMLDFWRWWLLEALPEAWDIGLTRQTLKTN